MLIQRRLLNAADFWTLTQQLANADRHLQLIDGVPMETALSESERAVVTKLAQTIETHVRKHKMGQVTVDVGFYRPHDAQNVRFPDLSFTSYERTVPIVKEGFMPYMPDLAVLVQPKPMAMVEIAERGLYFLKHGTTLVWILHPDTGTIDVCSRTARKRFQVFKLHLHDTLSGGEALPGFSIPVSDVFATFKGEG